MEKIIKDIKKKCSPYYHKTERNQNKLMTKSLQNLNSFYRQNYNQNKKYN